MAPGAALLNVQPRRWNGPSKVGIFEAGTFTSHRARHGPQVLHVHANHQPPWGGTWDSQKALESLAKGGASIGISSVSHGAHWGELRSECHPDSIRPTVHTLTAHLHACGREYGLLALMAVTPVGQQLFQPPERKMLTPRQWQFKFFDVSRVKLPEEDGSFLSEVPLFPLPRPTSEIMF